MTLKKDINSLFEGYYKSDDCFRCAGKGSKIIHEPLYGTFEYKEHEIAIIDSAPVQRLKYIHQLGLAFQVFPGTRHTRFEHSIGVVNIVNRFLRFLAKEKLVNKCDINTIRLSACLHDIGHGPFSHISENVMRTFDIMKEEKRKNDFVGCSEHEILSYHMIKSKRFTEFLENIESEINIEEIPNYIIGRTTNPTENQYKADLINGQFDADKLDYITRDGYFSGLPISIDIDRLLFSASVDTTGGKRKIVLSPKGIGSVQQLLFDKVMLFSTVYQHQKLKAIDQMIQLAFEMIIDEGIEIFGKKIESPIDLLSIDDYQFLNLKSESLKLNELTASLKMRKVFCRSLVISPKTVTKKRNLSYFMSFQENPGKIKKLRTELAERIGGDCTKYDIAIEIPKQTPLKEAEQKVIRSGANEFIAPKDVFPSPQWLNIFSSHQWKAWIFAKDEFREKACQEGIELLEEKFELCFNEEAIKQCRINF